MFKSDLIALQYKLLRSKQALCKMKNNFSKSLHTYHIKTKQKKKKTVGNIDNVGGKPVRNQRSVTAPLSGLTLYKDTGWIQPSMGFPSSQEHCWRFCEYQRKVS